MGQTGENKQEKILIVEDDRQLNLLISRRLEKLGYKIESAFSGRDALTKLKTNGYKLMLLDYELPAMTAKKMLKQVADRLPFIIMTGYGDEKMAVEMMKLGAYDYIVKDGNFLELMPTAVNSTLKEIDNERKIIEINQTLNKEREKYKLLFENTGTAMLIIEPGLTISLLNNKFARLTGYAKEKLLGMKIDELPFLPTEEKEKIASYHHNRRSDEGQAPEKYETQIITKSGCKRYLLIQVNVIDDTNQSIVSVLDITERKQKEKELNRAYARLNENVNKAQQLHELFLPPADAEIDNWQLAAYYHSAEQLGGDFYNFYQTGNELVFYMADVSGHGLDGAMLNLIISEKIDSLISASCQFNSVGRSRNCSQQELAPQPTEMISAVFERYLEEEFSKDYFLCLQLGVVDLNSGKLKYSNAGFQILPYIVLAEGGITSLASSSFPITTAVAKDEFQFTADNYQLSAGDNLFLTTDGLIEIMNDGELYGEQRLKKILQQYHYLPPDMLVEKIKHDFKSFKEVEAVVDDITFLAMENKGDYRLEEKIASTTDQMYELEEKLVEFLTPFVADIDMLRIGFHEIFTNALEHGNCYQEEKQVEVEAIANDSYIRVTIADQGSGFAWQDKLGQKLDYADFSERGRGIIIADDVYDQVCYDQQGSKACLIKFR